MNKVLYNISGRSFYRNQLGRKISEVISCWDKLPIELDVYCGGDLKNSPDTKSTEYGASKIHNSKVRKIKYLLPLVRSLSEFKDIVHDVKAYFFLKNKISKSNYDLVWERSSRLHFASLLLAKKYRIPFVLEWKDHLVDYDVSLFVLFAKWVECYKVRKADYIVVESYVLKEELEKKFSISGKIIVAHNAVNTDEFKKINKHREAIRSQFHISSEQTLVCYIGSFAFYHDTIRLVLAAYDLYQRGVDNVKFLLVGNGKEYLECLEKAKELDIKDRTLFFMEPVPMNNVPHILSGADITVLPGSTDIICPIKVFEYMSSETVAIIPDYKCNSDVIRDGVSGALFKPFDEIDLANTIRTYADDKELANKIRKSARKEVIENYSWDSTWGKVLLDILG